MTDVSTKARKKYSKTEIGSEFARKGIHILIAAVPVLAAINLSNAILLLMVGTLFYAWAESMRFLGFSMPFISGITAKVARKRDKGRFSLGPVTLGLGAILSLLLFPAPAAAAAIYGVAFGDSAAGLTGKFLGRLRPHFLSGKSIEGFLACFAAAGLSGFAVFNDWKAAISIGLACAVTDALPFKDFDNLFMPLAAGCAALAFL